MVPFLKNTTRPEFLMKMKFIPTSLRDREDILPENVNFEIIDGFEKVTDKDAAVYTRRMARRKVSLQEILVAQQ